jgi:hypothetical protein
MNTRQLNTVWAILLLATLATWTIGEVGEHLGIAGPPAMLTLLAISFVKGASSCSTSWACAGSNSSGAAS